MTSSSSSTGPLTLFNELLLEGRAPDPDEFCAQYPEHLDLRERIAGVVSLREDLRHLGSERNDTSWTPPAQIGGFRVLGPLGRGGMGRVYLAEQLRPTWLFALKFMRPDRSRLERFQREAQLAARLGHAGIASVHASGVEEGIAYIATELVNGFSLRDLLKAGPERVGAGASWITQALGQIATATAAHRLALEVGEVATIARIVKEIADALGHAHQNGIVHRDVKPSNIMMTFEGTPKLIDFGLALPTGRSETRFTSPGVFVGSVEYAAPEQLDRDVGEIGPWTDTYALGITLFELLTRKRPSAEQREVVPAMRALNPKIPTGLDLVVQRALSRDPADRFQHGDEMAEALFEVATVEGRRSDDPGLDQRTSMIELPWLTGPPPAAQQVFNRSFERLRGLLSGGRVGDVLVAAFFGDRPLESHLWLASRRAPTDRITIVGRHSRAGLRLSNDPTVSLRHLAIVAERVRAGATRVRLLDLKTSRGFAIDGVGRTEAVIQEGSLVIQIGGYWLFILPVTSRPWSDDRDETWARLTRLRVVDERGSPTAESIGESLMAPHDPNISQVVLVPGVSDISSVKSGAPDSTAGTVGILMIDRPSGMILTPVTRGQLNRGLLLGLYNRCDVGSRDLWETPTISRVHLLLLAEAGEILAIDTASTNGTRIEGERISVGSLRGRTTLALAKAKVRWEPFRRL